MISALSDVGNPAPSLHEALQRAGLRRYVEAEEDRQAGAPSAIRLAHGQPHRNERVRPVDVCESPEGRPQPHHVCARLSRGRGIRVMTKSLPEPLMLDGKPHYTARQIAEMGLPGLPGTRRGVNARVLSESWPYCLRPSGRGGGKVYPLEALPDEAQAKIRRPVQPKPTQPAPADSASTQKKPNDKKRLFLGLEPGQRAKVEAKAEAVGLWRHYKQRVSREISIGNARKAFCTLWKAGQAGAEEQAWKALPSFGISSLYNWDRALAKGGLNALVDQRGQAQAGRGILDTDTRMRHVVLGMPAAHPHAGSTHFAQGLAVRFPSCRQRLPSVRTIRHWTKKWREENKVLWAHLCDPDAAKGRYGASVGRADEGVDSLNALWEVDTTKADVLLSDGQRHTILAIIDVWSRRVLLHVARTSPSTAVCTALRRAILAWGVPSAVRCDNGKEFISRHTRTAFKDLGIAQETAPPFQPERKPFIERALGTFSHDLLALLPGFCGHDVSDRQAIRSQRSFSVRFGQGENAEGRLTPEAFQEFCDKWCALYASRPHQGLGGLTPAFCASNWIGPVGMIEDERALDILLSEPAQGGVRTVHKKGISVEGLWHVAADLGAYIGRRVRIRLDEGDAERFSSSRRMVFFCAKPSVPSAWVSPAGSSHKPPARCRTRCCTRQRRPSGLHPVPPPRMASLRRYWRAWNRKPLMRLPAERRRH